MKTHDPSAKQKGEDKFKRIPTKLIPKQLDTPLRKPSWIRIKAVTDPNVARIKNLLRKNRLHSVCEEASCPNLNECFSKGTATFMIMGDKCTRKCTFCDVAHGRPDPLDLEEPKNLASAIKELGLRYIVITSVDRDDLKDGGAEHFANCIREIRAVCPTIKIETLVPDFKKKLPLALDKLSLHLPDVFNHNIETVPRLYKPVRIGSDYQHSLNLIQMFKEKFPDIPTKSGLMLGLGESIEEVKEVLADLKNHGCDMLTIGQYLQPSKFHAPVIKYATLEEFEELKVFAEGLGFTNVASGPMVRSSYHADLQAEGIELK